MQGASSEREVGARVCFLGGGSVVEERASQLIDERDPIERNRADRTNELFRKRTEEETRVGRYERHHEQSEIKNAPRNPN